MKTPHEQSFMPQDIHKLKWAIVEDKGYVGPPSDTPNERRVVPIRPARLHHEIDFNNRISQFRVPIEKFIILCSIARVVWIALSTSAISNTE